MNPLFLNYANAFEARHKEMKDVWGLSDEVVEEALSLVEETGGYDRDAFCDYDNLAINAEIISKSELDNEPELKKEYENGDFLFETKNWVVFRW